MGYLMLCVIGDMDILGRRFHRSLACGKPSPLNGVLFNTQWAIARVWAEDVHVAL